MNGPAARLLLGLEGRKLVLASASPRRRELLTNLGIEVEVRPSLIPEKVPAYLSPAQAVVYLAESKALAVPPQHPGEFVLGADTMVVHEGEILGKPEAPDEAESMLRRLLGSEHEVLTGVAVVDDTRVYFDAARSRVRFGTLSEREIEAVIESGEWKGKAGGYAIQGLASTWVEHLEGDYFNVVGLPLFLLPRLLHRAARGEPSTPPPFPANLRER